MQTPHKYLLKDYTFLHDYIIIDSETNYCNEHRGIKNGQGSHECQVFVAQIMGTEQLVKFNKVAVEDATMGRFQALVDLYQRGAVLADNLFILDEAGKLYFYVIEAYIPHFYPQSDFLSHKKPFEPSSSPYQSPGISQLSLISPNNRFTTLSHYLSQPIFAEATLNQKLNLIDKIKILLECVHQTGQAYINLNPDQIIIDVEDEDSIYLAPFCLKIQMGGAGDKRRRAYLSPEILGLEEEAGKEGGEMKIGVQMMIKADAWAFGCIMLEILFFCTPAFLAVNNGNQIKQIEAFVRGDDKKSNVYTLKSCLARVSQDGQSAKTQMLASLLQNCLQIDPRKRVLTSQRPKASDSLHVNPAIQHHFVPNPLPSPSTIESSHHDSELTLNFLHISNAKIKKQLRINVYLDRRYSLFVSPTDDSMDTHAIHKSIKVKSTFEYFYQLLQKPLLIQLTQEERSWKIYVNLCTLVLENQGRRVWNRPIIGSYCCKEEGEDRQIKIKIKSEIASSVEHIPYESDRMKKQIQLITEKFKKMPKKQGNPTANKENIKEENVKQSKPVVPKAIPCEPLNYFANINTNLEQIRQKWAQKASPEPQITPLCTAQPHEKPQRESLSIPSSLASSRQHPVNNEIENKLKEMMQKLQLF